VANNFYAAKQMKLSTFGVSYDDTAANTTSRTILNCDPNRSRCILSLLVTGTSSNTNDKFDVIDIGIGLASSAGYGTGNSTRIIQSVKIYPDTTAIIIDRRSPVYLNPASTNSYNNLVFTHNEKSEPSFSRRFDFVCSFIEFTDAAGAQTW
jgi:hypothetical protein